MNRRHWLVSVVCAAMTGCLNTPGLPRLQSGDDSERDQDLRAEVKTVGDVSSFANTEPIAVSGVGLVVGLEGTGGSAPPGGFRALLEEQLKKKLKVDNVKDLLASPNHSMVLVSGLIPAGAREGDPIDLEITLPPQSKTTSLRGGHLLECTLFNYDSTRNLDPNFSGMNQLVKGHPLAVAQGPLLVGLGDGDEAARLRRGKIWGGGRNRIGRPFYLVLHPDQQYARIAMTVAERINETFQSGVRGVAGTEMATAKSTSLVLLGVPPQYRHNLPRYLRVIRLIPLPEAPARTSPYCRRLAEELHDPARTITAALRLEALGTESIDTLKTGLASEHVLVRFTSAEALAYLGDPAGGETLARLVEQQPVLRAFCLTAMASLDCSIHDVKLCELLGSPSTETRCGAFRALQFMNERHELVQGELLNESFWLHRVAPDSPPLVHISSSRRAEVVLFGLEPTLQPPFQFLAGSRFTVTAAADDDRCTISSFSLNRGVERKQCTLALEDVIRRLADLGGTYPDVVELLRQADRYRCLSCPVAMDALPQATSVYELARAGASNPEYFRTDEEILSARHDFGATPNLFDIGQRPRITPPEAKLQRREPAPKR
jgi:hypothetical protein